MSATQLLFVTVVGVLGTATAVAACTWAADHPGGFIDRTLGWFGIDGEAL